MANTNLMAAWPQQALDSISDQLYPIFKDKLKGKFSDSSIIPIEIDYEVAAPPRVVPKPSFDWTETLQRRAKAANVESDVPAGDLAAAFSEMPGLFGLRCDPVIVGIKMQEGTRKEYRLIFDAACTIAWRIEGGKRYWWPRMQSSKVQLTPPDPEIERVLNEFVLPLAEPMINTQLEALKQQGMNYGNVAFAIPAVRSYPGVIASFLSLNEPATPPPAITVRDPKRTAVQMDAPLLEAVVNEALRQHAQFEIPRTCIPNTKTCIWARAGLRNAKIELLENNVGRASMEAYGGAGISIETIFGTWEGVAAIKGTPLAILRLTAEEGWIKVQFVVEKVDIVLELPPEIPWLIRKILEGVLNLLVNIIAGPISAFISLFKPGIFKPDHELDLFGRKVIIKLDQMTLDTLRVPEGKIVFEAAGIGVVVKG